MLSKQILDLRAEFAERYPGDAIFSDEADAAWREAYQAMRAEPEYKAAEEESKDLEAKKRKYLVQPPREGRFHSYETTHGYVWLFRRK